MFRQNAVIKTPKLVDVTKWELFGKIASIKFKIQQSFVNDK